MSLSVSESVEPAVRVARGASYLLLQGIVINIMGVFYFVFATRLLPTVADFGRISTVNIFAVLVVSVGSLGLPTAATRFIAKYVASEQEGQARIVYQKVLRVGIGLSILSLSSVVLGSQVLSQLFLGSPDFGFLFRLAGLDVFFQLLALFPLGALQGVYRFREVAAINIASNVLQFAGAVYLLPCRSGVRRRFHRGAFSYCPCRWLSVWRLGWALRLGCLPVNVTALLRFHWQFLPSGLA